MSQQCVLSLERQRRHGYSRFGCANISVCLPPLLWARPIQELLQLGTTQVELRRGRRNGSDEVIVIKFGEKLSCLQLISLFDRNPSKYALRLIGHRDLFG